MKSMRYSRILSLTLRLVILAAVIVIFLMPFYFLLLNSVKPLGEITKDTAALPSVIKLGNYLEAWERTDFPRAFRNSLSVTVFSLFGVVLFSSMAAYRIVRYPSRFNNLAYALCLAEMIIPFQVIMIPLVIVLDALSLMNSIPGLVFSNWGLGVAMGVFMFSGFIKSVPRDLEEAAAMEGAGELRIFFRVVFPLLKSIVFTLIILDTFWFWNDYLLPLIVISRPQFRTLPIAISSFMGQYSLRWDLALPALTMSIIPAAIAFFILQKNIVAGLVAGAVKG